MMGYYALETKRVEVTASQDMVMGKFSAMSDEQLLALMAQSTAPG